MTRPNPLIAALVALCATACAPALDWREFVPEGTDINVSFPCRPDRHARDVTLAGARAKMEMLACSANDTTFALAFIDVADPARVGATLAELRATATRNLDAVSPAAMPLLVKGMTPNEQAARLTIAGKRPDGTAIRAHVAFFARGLRVYQATVIGAGPERPVVDTFLGALKFPG